MTDPSEAASPAAVRLIFEYEGDEVRLVSQQPVDVVLPGPQLTEPRAGVGVEIRAEDGHVLASRTLSDAMPTSVEVFSSPEQGGGIERVEPDRRIGAFTVIVPAPPGADHVAVLRLTPSDTGQEAAPGVPPPLEAEELGRFTLELGAGGGAQ